MVVSNKTAHLIKQLLIKRLGRAEALELVKLMEPIPGSKSWRETVQLVRDMLEAEAP